MTQTTPAKPSIKHVIASHGVKLHRLAKTGHTGTPKAGVKVPAKSAG